MTSTRGAAVLLLPDGEKAGIRGIEFVENSLRLIPLTVPSPRRGEGK
jgi:hypothetical protein